VQFKVTSLIGPCSATVSIRFTSDGALLGEEEFNMNLAPRREESSRFAVRPGRHVLGAQITRWAGAITTNGFAWPDTTVDLAANQLLVRTIDLYCS
jgi:hypothetical protein